jgi:hypothetical protein
VKTTSRTPGGLEYEHEDGEASAFAGREMEALESERGTLAGVILRLERMLERSEEDQDHLRERLDELYRALNKEAARIEGAERKIDELVGLGPPQAALFRALELHHEKDGIPREAICLTCSSALEEVREEGT